MKLNRAFSIIATLLLGISIVSCVSEETFDESVTRIEANENQIATVNEQITAITGSITGLEAVDAQLKEYISSLNAAASELQQAINANAQDIEALEAQLTEEIDAAKLEQLEALKALEEDMTAKLATINLAQADLQAKDAELESKITSLKEYVDKELKGAKDWATATFSTIEQYNSTVAIIAEIKADIAAINKAIVDLEAKMSAKIDEAIAGLEQSIKTWVNTQLTAYYTIAQIDAKVAIIEKAIDDGDDALMAEINTLKTALSEQKTEITEAYKKAISEAITSNNGVIDGKIQTAVDEINGRITEEVATINQKISVINNRLDGIEENLAEIMSMIQSITVVPSFSDGDAALGEDETFMYFEVLPLEAAKKLEQVALTAFSLKAVSTIQTKADVEYKTLPVKAVKYEDDLVKITTSGKEISEYFFNGSLSLNARLSISDGLNSLSSTYFGLKPQGNTDITSLRIAEYKKKIVNRLILNSDNNLLLTFVDGSSIELAQHSAAPRLYLDYDGYWSVSYNNGETSSRIMNNNAEFINAGNLQVDNILSVRFIEDNNGRYAYQTYQTATPGTTIDELGTPVNVDYENSVQSIVEDHVHHTISITTIDGQSFSFKQARVVPTGISVLTNKIRLGKGISVPVDFRVNPSNATFDFDITSSNCEVSLDYVGEATKSSYVTTPSNVVLSKIEPVYDGMGARKEGQYRAFIKDLETSINYDDLLALVLTINDGLGQTVQLSTSAIEAKYSSNLLTEFKFLKANNAGALEDVEAVINGTNITIYTPFIFDKTHLIASFETNGEKVFVDNVEQTSAVTTNNFSSPIKYTVLSADGEKNVYTVTVNVSGLPVVFINTSDGSAITSKEEWRTDTYIKIVNPDGTVDYENSQLQIRGRGNFTWSCPKKPYALKLEKKNKILGMPKHKRWVLLANWQDRTLIRNEISFFVSRQTGLAWTPRGKFIELIFNGKHVGNYYLCEQIKVDENRVNIREMKKSDISGNDVTGGYLVELDNTFDEEFKFKSSICNLPFMFKEPDEDIIQSEQFTYFQDYINQMETFLYSDDWLTHREHENYMDFTSFVDYWIVYELVRNIELYGPRSCYMHKDKLGKLIAGPVWDFDYSTFVPSQDFVAKNHLYYGRLFNDPVFVNLVKTRWASFKPSFETVPDYIQSLSEIIRISNEMNIIQWPISVIENGDENLSYPVAIERMISSFQNRLSWLDNAINNL